VTDWLVATDLDGTLLDDRTYGWAGAAEALALVARRGIPLVLCSSKTRAEMTALARDLETRSPLVVENGGALVIPEGTLQREVPGAEWRGSDQVLPLGTPHGQLAEALGAIARETGAALVPFQSLTAEELEALTGLRGDAAARAHEREFDEPFLLGEERHAAAVSSAAERRGLLVTRGGCFWHLTGPSDKGRALQSLLSLYSGEGRRFTTLGLGDAGNDVSLLRAVDRAVLVPRPGGELDPDLAARLPDAERAPGPGSRGWNAAVLAVLEGRRLPPVGGSRESRDAR
jgi:mannosyl-3-phosphoglycerate phosphatase